MNRAAWTGVLLSSLLLSAGLIAPSGCDSDPKKGTGGAGGSVVGAGGGGGGPTGGAGAGGGVQGGGGAAGEAGAGGAAGGAGGGAGSGAIGGAGGTAPFGALDSAGNVFQACDSPGEYTTNVTTIAYGGPGVAPNFQPTYTPACLKVAPGTMVTFSPASAGDNFVFHPLTPSTYGTQPSPIVTPTGSGASATFTFATPGFYAFFCGVHGNDAGVGMAGVIWVQ